jgi:heme exporter protein A
MLTCDDLSVSFGENLVFKNIGFSLVEGAGVIIKGTNGSGKTTLLKTIAGLTNPCHGSVKWYEQNIKDDYQSYIRDINYIGVKNAIKPELTVIDNIEFWANLRGHPELIMAAITYFRLGEVLDIPCYKLSSGWQKRVALTKLITCPAPLWLLDEPEGFLDEEGKNILYNLINSRTSQGGIVIVASHNIDQIPVTKIIDIKDFA